MEFGNYSYPYRKTIGSLAGHDASNHRVGGSIGSIKRVVSKALPFSREQFRVECVSRCSVPWCPMAQINHT